MRTHEPSLRTRKKPRLTALAAGILGFAALTIGAREAHAGWTCGTIDGFNGGGFGQTSTPVSGVGASVVLNGAVWAFHTDALGYQRGATNTFGPWYSTTIDGNHTVPGQSGDYFRDGSAATVFGGVINVFYIDSLSAKGFLRRNYGDAVGFHPNEITDATHGQEGTPLTGRPASVSFGGKLYVFYTEGADDIPGHPAGRLWVGRLDGTAWSFHVLDGAGGVNGQVTGGSMSSPVVIVDTISNLMRVYYNHDNGTHTVLREAYSGDGVSWGMGTLDGNSQASGRTTHSVGNPSVAFSPKSGTRVFYDDYSADTLRVATLKPGVNWSFAVVDGAATTHGLVNTSVGGGSAAFFDEADQPNVFYEDNTTHALRMAWWNGSFWSAWVLDGGVGSHACAGATAQHLAYGGYSAVTNSVDHTRHVFYSTFGTGTAVLARHAVLTP
ncbi:MAG: hypothetical protein JWP87_6020 [Labilithrix sp.]|nr:hypothetical protein [Labilithrix sp.]